MDWKSAPGLIILAAAMVAVFLFRRWNTNRKMAPMAGAFDNGQYERKGGGLSETRYIGRFKGRRAVISYDPPSTGKEGAFTLEIACRAGWELYLRTRLKQKLLGWAASRGQKAELGDPALEGKITLHSDTPGPALRWFGDPEVRGLVTRWLLEEDAIFLALRDSNDLKERALVVHYAYMVPVRTEENVRILLDRLDWLAGRVEAG